MNDFIKTGTMRMVANGDRAAATQAWLSMSLPQVPAVCAFPRRRSQIGFRAGFGVSENSGLHRFKNLPGDGARRARLEHKEITR